MRKNSCKGTHYYIKKRIFPTILLFFMKSEREKLQFIGSKELLSDILDLGWSDGFDVLQQLVDATFATIMQEMFGKVEGKLFTIVTSDGQLAFQLTFCRLQLAF